MNLYVGAYVSSLSARNALALHTNSISDSIAKLATGKRVNSAADDPAAISRIQNFDSEIRGLEQGKRNILDGFAMLDSTDAALRSMTEQMQQVREIFVQAENGTYSDAELISMQDEVNEIIGGMDSIVNGTVFNGRSLLNNGSAWNVNIQWGADAGNTKTISFDSELLADDFTAASGVRLEKIRVADGVSGLRSFDNTGGSATDLNDIDDFITQLGSLRGQYGAKYNSLESIFNYVDGRQVALASAKSGIEDADIALETSLLSRNQILQQTATSMLSQANAMPNLILSLLN